MTAAPGRGRPDTAPALEALDGRWCSAEAAETALPHTVVSVLAAALGQLSAESGTVAPVVLAATDYSTAATARYVRRCAEAEADGRRLRPSSSMEPEPGQLLQRFARHHHWAGPGYVLISPEAALEQGLRWARAGVGAGLHRGMVVCALAGLPDGDGYRVRALPVAAPGEFAEAPPSPAPLPEPDAGASERPDGGTPGAAPAIAPPTAPHLDPGADQVPGGGHAPGVGEVPGGGAHRVASGSVVLSGVGLVTALGEGVDAFWRGLLAGKVARRPVTRFPTDHFRTSTACETPLDSASDEPVRQRLVAAARAEAMADAGLPDAGPDAGPATGRTLVVHAGVVPHLPSVAGAPGVAEIALGPEPDDGGVPAPASHRALLAHACATGVFGLAMGREWLLGGLADTVVLVGTSALNAYDFATLDVLRATSTADAHPFDQRRRGVVIGEGAGVLVLETAERAAARGHAPAAELAGVACRVGGAGTTALNAELGAACMREALDMAGLRGPDAVLGHAPGTRQGDEAELLALELVGDQRNWTNQPPVSSYKGGAGHLLHAAVFPAVAAAVRALREGTAPGTPGLGSPLDARRVRILREPERCDGMRSVLVNNFGFGGNNAAAVLTHGGHEWRAARSARGEAEGAGEAPEAGDVTEAGGATAAPRAPEKPERQEPERPCRARSGAIEAAGRE